MKLLFKMLSLLRQSFRSQLFGFVQGHEYLSGDELGQIYSLVGRPSLPVVAEFEDRFAAQVGNGRAISFASGRMAFYSLMKVLGIGEGDEVILPAFTCAVMPNAVIKTGARPVYADIDRSTFGSDAQAIEKVLSKRTKLIVAQHSFGIPCNIHEIIELARGMGIYVVEDCAITFDSSLQGTKVGNWGDAAIFSTDHSKPLSTLVGGLLYTNNPDLYLRVKEFAAGLPALTADHQHRLYEELLNERICYRPDRYPKAQVVNSIRTKLRKICDNARPVFLEDDYGATKGESETYPYPAVFPAFLAQLGIFELQRWPQKRASRRAILIRMVDIFSRSRYSDKIPSIYSDPDRDIVPLRFVFTCDDNDHLRSQLARIIDTNWIWFQQPVIGAINGLESMGYAIGSCPVAEDVCSTVINLPCNIYDTWSSEFCLKLKDVLYTG